MQSHAGQAAMMQAEEALRQREARADIKGKYLMPSQYIEVSVFDHWSMVRYACILLPSILGSCDNLMLCFTRLGV